MVSKATDSSNSLFVQGGTLCGPASRNLTVQRAGAGFILVITAALHDARPCSDRSRKGAKVTDGRAFGAFRMRGCDPGQRKIQFELALEERHTPVCRG